MKLLRNALFLVAAAVQCFGAVAPINVQKADGVNNLITGNLTVGDGRMINATGTGQIIATGSVPALPINLAAGGAGGVTGNLPVGNLNSGTSASSSTFWRGDGAWAAANPTSGSSILAGNGSGGFTNVTPGSGLSYSSPTLSLSNIPVTALNGGTAAGPTTFWRGDGTWATPAGGVGTVTSVGASVPSFLSVSGPITTAGTLAITYSGTALPIANGGTAGTTAATARTNLGLEIGTNIQAWSANLDTWSAKTAYAGTVMVTTGKTFTSSNTLTLTGTDGSSLAIGNGGTLGTAAFQPTTAFEVPLTFSTGLTRTSNTITAGPMNLASTAAGGVTGNLPVARLNGGALASSTTFWRGDGTWANPERQSDGNGIQAGNGTGGFYAITIGSNLTFAGGTLSATGGGGGGSPGGTPGQIQWNSAGNFAGFTTSGDATINTTTGALTLATVASAGTTGSSTAIPVVTINAKGLATSITTAAVVAPAGTLTGTTLASGVTASSLLSANGGSFGTAAFTAASAYEVPLTFSTGLTRTVNTVTVNASQSIATLSNLTTNGFVKTGGGVGTLSIDTNTYLTAAGAVTSITGTANQVIASASVGAVTLSTPQDIGTASTPQFANMGLSAAASTTAGLTVSYAPTASQSGGVGRKGVDVNTTILSTNTTVFNAFLSQPSTPAAAMTLSTMRHFIALGGTLGAGSSITNVEGFRYVAGLSGASTTRVFYSDLPAGTGTYNLYLIGDAPNLLVGATEIRGVLQIGQTGAVGSINFSQDGGSLYTTLKLPAGLNSTYQVTLPNAASTLPIYGAQITYTGPTAARTVTYPDQNFTVARTDAANTFTGTQTGTFATGGSSTATTQTAGTSDTTLATTAFVQTAVLQGVAKEAVKYASTAALPTVVYANGSSGVGATLTGAGLGALSLDSNTPSVNDRVNIKNQVSTFQNGIYTVTAVGSGAAVFVMTRAVDFNQSVEIKTGDSVFVTSGTVNGSTTWVVSSADSPVIGTDAITFSQTAGPGSITSGNGITVTGASVAIDTSVTLDKTTVQTASNKTFTSPVINGATSSGSTDVDLSGNSGATKTTTGANQLSGTVTVTGATNPSITLASGKTNTGNFTVNGKTSGSTIFTTADATAQNITITTDAQTSGAATIHFLDRAGVSANVVVAPATLASGNIVTGGGGAGVSTITTDSTAKTALGVTPYGSGNIVLGDPTITTYTGTAVTWAVADDGKRILMTNASASTFTINNSTSTAYLAGAQSIITQTGAGNITITAADGNVTIRRVGNLVTLGANSTFGIIVDSVAAPAITVTVFGALTP